MVEHHLVPCACSGSETLQQYGICSPNVLAVIYEDNNDGDILKMLDQDQVCLFLCTSMREITEIQTIALSGLHGHNWSCLE